MVYAWVGLEDFAIEGAVCVGLYPGDAPVHTHWQPGEPNNAVGGEDCGMISSTSKNWIDEDCERDHYPLICEM